MDERWTVKGERMNVNFVRFDSTAVLLTYTVQFADHQVGACDTVFAKLSVIDPVDDVLQRPAERPGFMLPTALQAHRVPALPLW